MLEFFTVAYLAENFQQKRDQEHKRIMERFNGHADDQKISMILRRERTDMNAVNLIAGIIALIIAVLTARLAYDCNAKSDVVVRIFSMLFGFFFSAVYLLYYFIRYVLLQNKC